MEASTKPMSSSATVTEADGLSVPALRTEALLEQVPRVRRREATWVVTCLIVDGVMLATAILVAELGAVAAGVTSTPTPWLCAFALLVLVFFRLRGMYAPRLRLQVLDDVRLVLAATSVAAMAVICARVLLTDDASVADQGIRIWAFASAYLAAGRAGLFWAQAQARRRGHAGRPTLIVGAGNVGRLVARRLLEHPEYGLRPVGFIDKEPLAGEEDDELPVLGASWDLSRILIEQQVEHVVMTFSTAPHHVLLGIMRQCEQLGIGVSLVPRLFEKVTERVTVEHLGGLPLLSAHPSDPKGWQFAVKYALDRLVGAVGVLLALPLLAISALAVWLSLGRPILFRQVRVGRDGRPFEMVKFRSMRPSAADQATGPRLMLPADTAPGGVEGADRRTRVGAFLRRTSLDELPQLLNVVKGEMSLVGPRPERPEFVGLFQQRVYRYPDRHRVKAGITGWAQVHGLRGKTSIADRVEWDNYYIENWSLWLDLKIVVMTALAVLSFFRKGE